MQTPARDMPPVLEEGAWVRVKNGWLTGRAAPESREQLVSWGAHVVVSLQARFA